MSEQPAASQHPQDAARSYEDPHGDARSSQGGTAGPEDRDPVDSMQTASAEDDERAGGPPTPPEGGSVATPGSGRSS
jgi:hypothetical protein